MLARMTPRELFGEPAKARIKSTVRAVESKTAAELVVTARHASGNYRSADYLVGVLTAFCALAVFLYYPEPFEFTFLPLELFLAFGLGVAFSIALPPVRRLFLSRKRMHDEVLRSARSAFFDLGVGRTTGRTGILVFVSAFEKAAIIVPDVGVPKSEDLERAKDRVGQVMRTGDLSAFVTAVTEVGQELSLLLPRSANDENELPDDMREAAT